MDRSGQESHSFVATRESIRRKVWNLSAPTLAEMFMVSLTGMVDMIQVGRIGPAAITSVGLTNQPMMLLQSVFQALNVGTTALVARLTGVADHRRASHILKQTLIVTFILGITVSAVAGLGARCILLFMGAEQDVIEIGVPYFRVVGYGFIFNALAMAVASGLRGAGDTVSPMTVNLSANLVNVVLNWILIWGKFGFPRWGVFGAGVATTFSRFLACVWFFCLIVRGSRSLRVSLAGDYHFDGEVLGRIYNIGLPAAMEQIVLRSGQLMFARVVATLGTAVFAAHQVGMNILTLTFMPGQAFATGATTLVGQSLGREDPEEAERCAFTSRNMGLAVGGFMAVIFLFFGRYLAMLYTDDISVAGLTATILKIYAFAQPFQSTQFILAGALRGAGDTRYPLYSTAVGIWFGRVLLGWLLVNLAHLGLPGAWLGMAADQVGRGCLISIRFRNGKWKEIAV